MGNELYHYGTPKHSGRYPWGSGENPFHHGESAPGWFKKRKKNQDSDDNDYSDLAKNNKRLLNESISRVTDGLDTSKGVKIKRNGTDLKKRAETIGSAAKSFFEDDSWKDFDGDTVSPSAKSSEQEKTSEGTKYKVNRLDKKVQNWEKGTKEDLNKPPEQEKPSEDTNYKVKREDSSWQTESNSGKMPKANKNEKSESKKKDKEAKAAAKKEQEEAKAAEKKKQEEAAAKRKQAELDKLSGYKDLTSNAKTGVDALGKISQRVETKQSLNARNQRFIDASHMDDQSLDLAIKRMEKEQKYVNLTGNYINKGQTSVSDILATTGDILATTGAVLGMAYTIKKLMD